MKKIVVLSVALLAFLFAGCDKTQKTDDEEKTVEITEATLSGTWEGGVEADFAQGYPQKWRIRFEGKAYTTWHTHKTAGSIKDEVQGLKTVGNKEKGTWEYADGVLTLTPKEQFASYYQEMKPDYSLGGYVYYEYNEDTMEAVQWYVTSQTMIESGIARDIADGTDWYISKWKQVSLIGNTLSVKINMDTFKLVKQ